MARVGKRTKKFQKRHLAAEVKVRKKHQKLAKSKANRLSKEQISVERAAAKVAEVAALRAAERQKVAEGEGFVSGPADEGAEEDLHSLGDSDADLPSEASSLSAFEDSGDDGSDAGDGDGEGEDKDMEGSDDEEDGPFASDNKKLRSAIEKHKAELELLKEKDPEFYAYLQQADKGLIDFDASEDEADEAARENGDELGEAAEGADDGDAQETGARELTMGMVSRWCKAVKDGAHMPKLVLLLKAYKLACAYGNDQQGDAERGEQMALFSSGSVYTKVLVFVLKEADNAFRRILGVEKRDRVTLGDCQKSKRWKKLERFVKLYASSTLYLLTQATDDRLLAFTLRRLRASAVFLGGSQHIMKNLLRGALEIFGNGGNGPRLQAILLIRELAILHGRPILDACMKGVYSTFVSKAGLVNRSTSGHIHFMATCVVEIYGLHADAAYEHAFGYIRQLAVQLREAISEKRKNSLTKVFSWRYINCLELWAKLVAAHSDKGDMRHLVYPVSQILSGLASFRQQPRIIPLRLRVIRALNRLSTETGYFIPVARLLLGILQWPLLLQKQKLSAGEKAPDMSLTLKLPQATLNNAMFQAEVVEQVMELLARHAAQWSYTVSFPELSYWITFSLRKFARATPTERFRVNARQLIASMERTCEDVQRRRDSVDFSPKDLDEVENFAREGRRQGESPIESYARQLEDRARRRHKMQSSEIVTVREDDNEGEEVEDEDEEDDQVFEGLDRGRALVDTEADAEAEERAVSAALEGKGADEDVVEDYVLSEDDDGDDDDEGGDGEGGRRVAQTGPAVNRSAGRVWGRGRGGKGGTGAGRGKSRRSVDRSRMDKKGGNRGKRRGGAGSKLPTRRAG
eukprot:evm.model.scf_347.12 EVM.evm.TU.scf_347.12   scf_347:81912-91436(+)